MSSKLESDECYSVVISEKSYDGNHKPGGK